MRTGVSGVIQPRGAPRPLPPSSGAHLGHFPFPLRSYGPAFTPCFSFSGGRDQLQASQGAPAPGWLPEACSCNLCCGQWQGTYTKELFLNSEKWMND